MFDCGIGKLVDSDQFAKLTGPWEFLITHHQNLRNRLKRCSRSSMKKLSVFFSVVVLLLDATICVVEGGVLLLLLSGATIRVVEGVLLLFLLPSATIFKLSPRSCF